MLDLLSLVHGIKSDDWSGCRQGFLSVVRVTGTLWPPDTSARRHFILSAEGQSKATQNRKLFRGVLLINVTSLDDNRLYHFNDSLYNDAV